VSLAQAKVLVLIVGVTLVSGIADAQGFIHASRIWQNDRLVWGELGKSALGFVAGIATYWVSLRYMKALGVMAPELQTLVWFGVTLIGVAVISGKVLRWPLLDQGVAVAVLAGIGWLIFRANG
jgi:hypothetical protein